MGNEAYVLGIDYGTDSVRTLIVNARDGSEISSAVNHYARWKEGRYCDPAENRFRQHPIDHIEGLESSVSEALALAPANTASNVKGIAVDTTGSTPAPVTRDGTVLGMFDVSARPCVPKHTLTFTVPFARFEQMVANMDESFLITDSWKQVKRRIK